MPMLAGMVANEGDKSYEKMERNLQIVCVFYVLYF